ncbi:MAG: hypothetical protein FH749_06890 [Firmicutes bacterium]|nr:hypothetical protein [Bacillota bacterium]
MASEMKFDERREIIEMLRGRFAGLTIAELKNLPIQGGTINREIGQWWSWNVLGRNKNKGVTLLGEKHGDGWIEVVIPWSEIAKDEAPGQIDIYDLLEERGEPLCPKCRY